MRQGPKSKLLPKRRRGQGACAAPAKTKGGQRRADRQGLSQSGPVRERVSFFCEVRLIGVSIFRGSNGKRGTQTCSEHGAAKSDDAREQLRRDIGEDESARRRPISAKALEHSTMLA